MLFARIFRGGYRGREPAVVKKVNACIKQRMLYRCMHGIEVHSIAHMANIISAKRSRKRSVFHKKCSLFVNA